MIVSITKIELNSLSVLGAFFKLNRQIIQELKQSKCLKHKATGSLNLKVWYTMTLWENEKDINDFYRNKKHLEAMKKSNFFSSKILSNRINTPVLLPWKDAKKLFANP